MPGRDPAAAAGTGAAPAAVRRAAELPTGPATGRCCWCARQSAKLGFARGCRAFPRTGNGPVEKITCSRTQWSQRTAHNISGAGMVGDIEGHLALCCLLVGQLLLVLLHEHLLLLLLERLLHGHLLELLLLLLRQRAELRRQLVLLSEAGLTEVLHPRRGRGLRLRDEQLLLLELLLLRSERGVVHAVHSPTFGLRRDRGRATRLQWNGDALMPGVCAQAGS